VPGDARAVAAGEVIAGEARWQQIKRVIIVACGNFLEMYDFMVFGYYAPAIARAFFPAGSESVSLLLTLMTFGAGFLMRPVGALVLGAYLDRHGRKKGLLLTLALMAIGTAAIAIMPPYAQIGLAAPLLILLARLIQGLSAGVEVGGVSVYLAEIAPSGKRGFYVAWQSASQQAAVVFAALVGILLNQRLGASEMAEWGWRIPFVIGCALIPFLILIRRSLEETPDFMARQHHPRAAEVFASIAANWKIVVGGMFMATMTTVFFYMITAYTPTYGTTILKLPATDTFLVTLCVGMMNFILLPTMGALSDRVGRAPLLIGASVLAVLTGYPALHWLVSEPSLSRLLTVQIYFAIVYSTYNGAMIVFLTELMPRQVRTTGFSLAYGFATALFGGFTPAISTYLIKLSGDRAIPGAWLSLAAIMGLLATLAMRLVTRPRKAPA
jgi:metabolite-proton symporter